MKSRRKLLSILLTLSLLVTLLVPMVGPASAETKMWCPKVENVTDGSQPALGSLFINVDPGTLSSATESLEIKLPSDVDFIDSGTAGYVYGEDFDVATANDTTKNVMVVAPARVGQEQNAISNISWVTASMSTNKLTINLNASDANFAQYNTYLRIYFNKVDVDSGFSGEIKAIVTSNTNFPEGSVVIANAGDGAATIAIDDVNTLTESGQAIEQITIEENTAGAIKAEQETIELALPKGFEWQSVTVNGEWGFSSYAVRNAVYEEGDGNIIGWTLSSDNDTLKIHLGNKTTGVTGKGRITIDAELKIDESEAETGDVVAEISGGTDISPDTLVIAKYQEYGATVKEGTVPTIFAGREDANIGEFFIEENAPGSLYGGRSINLTLPDWAKWPADLSKVKVSVDDGDIVLGAKDVVDTDRHILKIKINTASDTKSKIKFKDDTEIQLAANASGPLEIEVGGTAGVEGKVKVAEVKAPVTATVASLNDVKIGVADQAIGDITITEAAAKALMEKDSDGDGKLKLEAPAGVTFSAVPTVTVTDGNVDIGTVTREAKDDESNRVVVIPIKSQSTKASTLKVSGIKLTVDRTVPEGDVTISVKGSAVERTSDEDEWKNTTSVAKVAAAKVVTPAPGELKYTSVFKIGDMKYTVNGVEKTMDVAPYIKDSRTFMPIRFVAQAAGVADNNILWNAADQSVILIKGDRVVKLTIGSNTMYINGIAFAMDVAPELVDPGRTMLPLRAVAQALGNEVLWDEATQSVTVK